MGEVIWAGFGRKRAELTGFIPDELGREATNKRKLITFAKQGEPTLDHANPTPHDWWNGDDDCA